MKKAINNLVNALFHNPKHIFYAIIRRIPWIIPNDRLYLEIIYHFAIGKKLDLKHPNSYNEKLQWIKLYDKRPEYTTMVDKRLVKQYVSNIIGAEYIIPTIGYWEKPEDIEWDKLPMQFVLKTTHDGGNHGVFVCKDKNSINKKQVIQKLKKSIKRNTFLAGREWPYKNVHRCIIAEQYLEDESKELRDYKFFAFDGVVRAMFVATERQTGDVKFDYFDAEFNHLELIQVHPMSNQTILKPKTFELMKQLAEKLSKGFPEMRVDFYEVNNKPYFGEITLFHHGGVTPFHPQEWDVKFGSWITLPKEIII